jgi:predicted RNA methylase
MAVVFTETQVNNTIIKREEVSYALIVDGVEWMRFDDSYISREQLYTCYDLAYGKVLLTGFGFGVLADWVASKDNVREVHVIEKYPDVIECFLKNNKMPNKVKVIIADASEYRSGESYDCIFIDHYEILPLSEVSKEICKVSKNIPNYSVIWGWQMEEIYNTDLDILKNYSIEHNKVIEYIEKYNKLPKPTSIEETLQYSFKY